MRPVRQHTAVVCFGLLASYSLLAQSPASGPTTTPATAQAQARPISPGTRQVPPGMMYHHVYIVSPLIGSGKPGDPRRPILVPAPSAPSSRPSAAPSVAAAPAASTAQTGLLGFQMQLSDDGKFALAELIFATPLAFQNALKNEVSARSITVSGLAAPTQASAVSAAATSSALITALQSAVPGLQIFERGIATESQILAAFQQRKASFSFSANASVRP